MEPVMRLNRELAKQNRRGPIEARGGLDLTSRFRLELDAETGHDSGRADVVTRRSSSKGDALEHFGAGVTRETRSQTTAHLSPGRAEIDVEMLVQRVVGEEGDLIIAAGALVSARAAGCRTSCVVGNVGVLVHAVVRTGETQSPSKVVLHARPVEIEDTCDRESVVVER